MGIWDDVLIVFPADTNVMISILTSVWKYFEFNWTIKFLCSNPFNERDLNFEPFAMYCSIYTVQISTWILTSSFILKHPVFRSTCVNCQTISLTLQVLAIPMNYVTTNRHDSKLPLRYHQELPSRSHAIWLLFDQISEKMYCILAKLL